MTDRSPRLLFVPVSSSGGMGEYARSLAIARGAERRWPGTSIHFMLSREAPYAGHAPYPATLLPSSPTFHSRAVIEVIEDWRPDVVIFDNAGRGVQLRAAQRSGARVVYISARPRQRRKAFRWRWMRLLDEHWIAYPKFLAGSLSIAERAKLAWLRRPTVRYLDVILDTGGAESGGALLTRIGCAPRGYVLVVPGGGASHRGASDAIDAFLNAARGLAESGIDVVFVGRDAAAAAVPRLRVLGPLPQAELAELMRAARLIVANGGSTLLQSIACGRPCIAAPIARDQGERIRGCAQAGVAVAVPLDAARILQAAADLWKDAAALDALGGRAAALGLADGMGVALSALDTWVRARRQAP